MENRIKFNQLCSLSKNIVFTKSVCCYIKFPKSWNFLHSRKNYPKKEGEEIPLLLQYFLSYLLKLSCFLLLKSSEPSVTSSILPASERNHSLHIVSTISHPLLYFVLVLVPHASLFNMFLILLFTYILKSSYYIRKINFKM